MWMLLVAQLGCLPVERGCNDPGESCEGSVGVDLTGDEPVFFPNGMAPGDTLPDSLSIVVCPDSVEIWDVWSIPADGFPVAWGDLPPGAEEIRAPNPSYPFVLEEGTTYTVTFGVRDADLDGVAELYQDTTGFGTGSSGVHGWSAAFTWGDPDSVVLDETCHGDTGDSAL